MKPIKRGQIVKFHTPYEDEDSNQLYLVHEVFEDGEKSRAKIEALDTGLSFPPIAVVYLRDLEIDELQIFQLDCFLKNC